MADPHILRAPCLKFLSELESEQAQLESQKAQKSTEIHVAAASGQPFTALREQLNVITGDLAHTQREVSVAEQRVADEARY